ncbi:effector binding domain-containing protein [Gorillibacterium timonense]|uniref:effector binding domain-containing protein n=1 Tax=Gorillibacterium timonense TaxID=1689269 RepID=UPI00071C6F84|nr:effector binding domain-containing protein [Gorillibacterium timonense]
MGKPTIEVFQMKHDEFLFLGMESSLQNPDFQKIWENFFNAGGFDKIEPYQKEPCPMNIWHNNNPEYDVYFIGKIVEGIDEAPEGYTLMKFPAREFLVVTHEWLSEHERIVGEDGNGQCNRYADNVQIPDGYIRYDESGSQIKLIEREYSDTENGHRYEVWVPIKKL